MKLISMICLFLCAATFVEAQGKFIFRITQHPTRIGSIDGPLAGPEIYGQMLVGLTPDSLEPILSAIPHSEGGKLGPGLVEVPNVPCEYPNIVTVYMQMVAWDSRLWGMNLEGVPAGQLGRTDVVAHYLECGTGSNYVPQFTTAAIVPIPEPPPWALAALAAPFLWMGKRLLRRNGGCRQFR